MQHAGWFPLTCILLFLQASWPILVSYYYTRHCQHPPQPCKLLLIVELLRLHVAALQILRHKWKHQVYGGINNAAMALGKPEPAAAGSKAGWMTSVAHSSVLGTCAVFSNNMSLLALQIMPLYAYTLLCHLKPIAAVVLAKLLLPQHTSKQACWSLLLLLAAIAVGQWSAMVSTRPSTTASSSSSSYIHFNSDISYSSDAAGAGEPLSMATWLQGLAVMAAVCLLTAGSSIYTEWTASQLPQHTEKEYVHLHNARLACWGVLVNSLWCFATYSSSGTAHGHVTSAAAASSSGTGSSWGCSAASTPGPAALLAAAPAAGMFRDMGAVHWAVAVILAATGPCTALVKQWHGDSCCVYAASLALLLAAGASQLLQQHPPLLVYVACCLAAAATLQLQQSVTQQQQAEARANKKSLGGQQPCGVISPAVEGTTWCLGHSSSSSGGGGGGAATTFKGPFSKAFSGLLEARAAVAGVSSQQAASWLLALLDKVALTAGLLSVLLLLGGLISAKIDGSRQGAAATQAAGISAAVTDVPMPAAVASMPCVDGTWLQRDRFCPVFNCSMAPSCTGSNPACCTHLNFLMLEYLAGFLQAKGLGHHYVIVYGSLLGAVRNHTILPHTNDVDLALSAAAITLLEQPIIQEELWRHGYVFWCSDNVWRLCAHHHHPSPAFQNLLRPGLKHTLQGGPYADIYLMWPSDTAAAAAVDAAAASIQASYGTPTAPFATAAAGHDKASNMPSVAAGSTASQAQQQQQQGQRVVSLGPAGLKLAARGGWSWSRLWGGWRRQEWQLCFSRVAVKLSGRRRAAVDGLRLVVPDNAEELLEGTYGPRWRIPNLRPYAPSFDEDECIAAVLKLNTTLFGA